MRIKTLVLGERLRKFEKDIKKITLETCRKINRKVKFDNITFLYLDYPQLCIPKLGHGAFTIDRYLVFVSLDTHFPNFKNKIVKIDIPRTIAHESVHVLRMRYKTLKRYYLLQSIIEEGIADHFDLEINGYHLPLYPWSTAVSEKDLPKYLKRIKKYFNSTDDKIIESCRFGNKNLKIPKWTAYSLGFWLVKEYLELTNKKPSDILFIKPEEIMKRLKL